MPTAELLLITLLHLVLTALPLVAAALLGARAGLRSAPLLLALALAAGALVGLLSFWAYYGDRTLGEAVSYLALLGSIAAIAWVLYEGRVERSLLRALAIPLALWALGSLFLVFLGFAHGGSAGPIGASLGRFSHLLPSDSQIPYFYSEWFFAHGHEVRAPVFPGEWLSSDRPPLQVGYVLSQRPFAWRSPELNYQILGVILQQLWIVGLWALLLAARVRPLTRGLVVLAVLLSDVAIVNGFFVWPKLLPAALLLALAAIVLTPLWEEVRGSIWLAALAAALAGLAMLGHGSSIFGILPLAIVAAFRGLPSWRWIAVALGVGVVLMGSWSAYQKYADPPGNRLTKWTLAGYIGIDDRGATETIVDAYSEAGLGESIHYKAENFVTMLGGKPMLEKIEPGIESGELGQVVRGLRAIQFFHLVPGLGLLLLGPLLMVAGRARRRQNPAEWRLALTCFLVFGIGAVLWGLIVFGNVEDRTLKHISSYLLPLLGIVGCVVGMRAVFPRFALYYVGAASLLSLALYAPSLDPPAGSIYSAPAIVLSALALGGFAYLALRPLRPAAAAAGAAAAAAPSR
jgi:hypothetical protein